MTAAWPSPPPTVTTCYRHPGRSAGVTCRRCERPICPECMIQAPVGWQCPECVHAGARTSPVIHYRPSSPSGLRVSLRRAPVTVALVVINLICFVASGAGSNSVLVRYGLIPLAVQDQGQVYRLFTSPFLHLSVTHIALNMLSLVIIGPPVEVAVGRLRYLALYLAAAFGGSVCYYLVAPPDSLAVGASGAIFGVFGAYFVIARRWGLQTGGIVALIVANLVFDFVQPGIGWQAHVGGLAAGAVLAVGFMLAERRAGLVARTIELGSCAAVAVALLALMQLPAGG